MNSKYFFIASGVILWGLVGCGPGLDNGSSKAASGGSQVSIPSGASLIFDMKSLAGSGSCTTTSLNDDSGGGNTGTLHCASGGGFAGTGTSADPYRVNFDGAHTYISTNFDAQSGTLPATTWLAWMRPSNTNFSHVLSLDNHGGAFNRALVIDNGSGQYGVFHPSTTWTSGLSVSTGQWELVAVVFTATDITLYRGGSNADFGSAPSYVDTVQKFTIGRSAGGSFDYFTGDIGWVGVYPRALSASEINQVCLALQSRYAGSSCN